MKLLLLLPLLMACACDTPDESATPPDPGPLPGPSVLVFTKTAGYRNESIFTGVTALKALGAEPATLRKESPDERARSPGQRTHA